LRKEMGERTAKGGILWNPLNRGGLRGLFATGERGVVILGLFVGVGAVALCVNTRIHSFRCRPAVQTGSATLRPSVWARFIAPYLGIFVAP
jgi:hypothetical protein